MAFFFTCGTHGMLVGEAQSRTRIAGLITRAVELTLMARSLPITPITLREHHLPMPELR